MSSSLFLIFGGERYYASGGGNDLLGRAASKSEADAIASGLIGKQAVFELGERDPLDDVACVIEWSHVFDVTDRRIVTRFGDDPHGYRKPAIVVRDCPSD